MSTNPSDASINPAIHITVPTVACAVVLVNLALAKASLTPLYPAASICLTTDHCLNAEMNPNGEYL